MLFDAVKNFVENRDWPLPKRNIVERLIGWLKECRRLFSRFEKTAVADLILRLKTM